MQSLSALEWIRTSPPARRILVTTPGTLSFGLLASETWEAVHLFDVPGMQRGFLAQARAWIHYRALVRDLSRCHVRPTALVIGHLGEMMAHAANAFAAGKVVLLDDGLSTLTANRWRHEAPPAASGLGHHVKKHVLGIRTTLPKAITFFTIYDITGGPDDEVVVHEFEEVRTRLRDQSASELPWFLGQALVESGVVSREAYLDGIESWRRRANTTSFVYAARLNEEEDKLDAIRRIGGVVRYDLAPVEVSLLDAPALPRAVGGFFSSALVNVRILFGERVDLVAVRPAEIEGETIGRVYEYLERSAGIDVLHRSAESGP